jgi:hypothetical protein
VLLVAAAACERSARDDGPVLSLTWAAEEACDAGECEGPGTIVEITAGGSNTGGSHTCARSAAGQLWCWQRHPAARGA